jgi:hypothetical protein
MDLVVSETNKEKKALLYEGFTYRIDFVLKSEAVSGRRRNNIMAKRKRTKAQTMIYKTLHIKQKVEHHE